MNTLNTKTHSSKEIAEFCFENADVKSICYCKQRREGTLSLSSECVETKLCKPCTSFISHLHGSCGKVWYRTLRMKQPTTTTSTNPLCSPSLSLCIVAQQTVPVQHVTAEQGERRGEGSWPRGELHNQTCVPQGPAELGNLDVRANSHGLTIELVAKTSRL